MYQLIADNERLVIVNAMDLSPLGTFGDHCPWEDVPDGGVLRVEPGAEDPPTVVTFSAGAAGGVGDACASGSHVVAWDVTVTRQP